MINLENNLTNNLTSI